MIKTRLISHYIRWKTVDGWKIYFGQLKIHKREKFFVSDFEFFTITKVS